MAPDPGFRTSCAKRATAVGRIQSVDATPVGWDVVEVTGRELLLVASSLGFREVGDSFGQRRSRVRRVVLAEVGLLREVLAKQAVGVLVEPRCQGFAGSQK